MRPFLYIFVFFNFAVLARTKELTASSDIRSNRARRSAQHDDLAPLSLQIASKISSRFANTLVTSVMANNSSRSREAIFLVYLPETAFISNFSMVVDGKVYVGKVKEKNAAKEEYLKAKNNDLNTGLVSQAGTETIRGMETFVVSFNVAPHSTTEFRLNYQQLLERRKGYYEKVISVRPKRIIPLLKVKIDVEEPQAFSFVNAMKIRSDPSDAVEMDNPLAVVQRTSSKSVHIEYSPSVEEQKKLGVNGVFGDFIVRYDLNHGRDAGILQVLDSYFVQYFSPSGLNPLSKNVVLVIDVSGSMSGTKITQTRQAMHAILDRLRSDDSFNIVLFNGGINQWKSEATLASPTNILEAKGFVESRVQAKGSTNINDALLRAINLLKLTSKVPLILFLTDGQPSAGETNPSVIRTNILTANKIDASIFSLGFGFHLNFDFLRALSSENRGKARRIYPDKDAASQLEGFFDEISSPLLDKIEFHYPKELVDETSTTAVSFDRYYQGSELVVCGKLNNSNDLSRLLTVDIRGHAGNKPVTYSLSRTLNDLTVSPNQVVIDDFIERLWAYKKIKELLVQLLVSNNNREKIHLRSRALQLSLEYNFVTPLTSLIVVQSQEHDIEQKDVLFSRGSVMVYSGSGSAAPGPNSFGHTSSAFFCNRIFLFVTSFFLAQFLLY